MDWIFLAVLFGVIILARLSVPFDDWRYRRYLERKHVGLHGPEKPPANILELANPVRPGDAGETK